MSGSAQFSADQFHVLAEQLREQAETVWIIDCRMESHGLVNGIAVSWCGEDNGANSGLSVDEIEAEEQSLSSLIGTDITAYTAENDLPVTAGKISSPKSFHKVGRLADEKRISFETLMVYLFGKAIPFFDKRNTALFNALSDEEDKKVLLQWLIGKYQALEDA